MGIGHLLFKTNGRINKKTWWLTQILLVVFIVITGWLWRTYGFHDAIFGFIGTATMFWIRININIKRLHDINLSGWWLVLFESFPALGMLGFGLGLGVIFSGIIGLIGYVIGFFVLGFKGGIQGSNEYGEEPTS